QRFLSVVRRKNTLRPLPRLFERDTLPVEHFLIAGDGLRLDVIGELRCRRIDRLDEEFPDHADLAANADLRAETVGKRDQAAMAALRNVLDIMLDDQAADPLDIDRHPLAVAREAGRGGDVILRTGLIFL